MGRKLHQSYESRIRTQEDWPALARAFPRFNHLPSYTDDCSRVDAFVACSYVLHKERRRGGEKGSATVVARVESR